MYYYLKRVKNLKKIITKIEPQKKNKERVNVYINEDFAFACSLELLYYHKLKKDMEVSIENLEEVVREDNYIKGKNIALKYIEKSMKTEHQVRTLLIKKEYSDEVIDKVVKFLESYDFLNDTRYVESYVKQKIQSDGKNKIKFSLARKGIAEELIKEVLSKINTEDEVAVALKFAKKRFDILCKSERDKNKILNKISQSLLGKGFNYSIINEVLPKLSFKDLDEDNIEKVETDYEELMNIAMKRYTILKKSEDNQLKLKKKLQDFLLRKGYNYDEVKKVITKLLKEEEIFD